MCAVIYIWFLLWFRSLIQVFIVSLLGGGGGGSGGGCSRFHPRKSERSAGDEEANFYKNGMKIKTSEGIMD